MFTSNWVGVLTAQPHGRPVAVCHCERSEAIQNLHYGLLWELHPRNDGQSGLLRELRPRNDKAGACLPQIGLAC